MKPTVIPAKAGIQFQINWLPTILAGALISFNVLATTFTPSGVFAYANQLNGQKISVQGIITNPKTNTSPNGGQYQTFQLCDAGACLNVYTRDTNTYTAGAQQTLTGRFWAVRHEGYKTRFNELVLPSKTPSSTTSSH